MAPELIMLHELPFPDTNKETAPLEFINTVRFISADEFALFVTMAALPAG